MQQATFVRHEYVFDTRQELPKGPVKVTIVCGDAWVFTEDCNFILHRGEERTIMTKTAPTIRRAYTRGFAKFQVESII